MKKRKQEIVWQIKICKIPLLMLLVFLNVMPVFAQSQKVTGKVSDKQSGEPLPGVTVLLEGTTNGTVSDANGNYAVRVEANNKTIKFSFVGYVPVVAEITGKNIINVEMEVDNEKLEEVMVVGYGSLKKSDITGSITSVKSEQLKLLPTQRADQSLQGRAAGVMVLNTDGAPGGNTTIRIRGMNSINGGNEALVVIDGVMGGNINTINPADIESIEVLKDASSTAIYGSKGANGVIIITTKGNQKGKPSVNYSASFGVQTLAKKLDLMNAYDFATLVNLQRMRGDVGVTPIPIFSQEELDYFKTIDGTDWQDEIYRMAPIQNHSLSVNGGNDATRYFFSLGYLNQDGILINTNYKRYNVRGAINSEIREWLKTGINISLINTDGSVTPFGGSNYSSNVSSAILLAPRWPANIPVYQPDGSYSMSPNNYGPVTTWNPVASANETDSRYYQVDNSLNAYLDFKILEGLSLKINGSGRIVTDDNRTFWNEKTKEGLEANGFGGKGFVNNRRYEHYQNSNILTYEKKFEQHSLTVTAVDERQIEFFGQNQIDARDFYFVPTGLNNLAGAKVLTAQSPGAYKRVLLSQLARVNYSLAGKYLLTASVRRDGSSVFGKNNKWAMFPSAAIGWRVSEESFMKSFEKISELKLRVSYGVTGNQGISPYQSLASIGTSQSAFNYPYYGTENSTQTGFGVTNPSNPNLKWESTAQTNIGVDAGFFKNRLTVNADVYSKHTNDLLMYRTLPGITGLYSMLDNIGSTRNEGIEITVGGDPLVGKVKWNTNFTASLLRMEVLDIGDDEKIQVPSSGGGYGTGYLAYITKGGAFGDWYGYTYLGTWKNSEKEQAKKYGKLPGEPKYLDINNDNAIDAADISKIGNGLPEFIFGWNNNVSAYGFDLAVFIQGVTGNDVFNTPRIKLEAQGSGTSTALLDYWTAGRETDMPGYLRASDYIEFTEQGIPDTYNIDQLYSGSTSRWVEDGSYLRIKNVTLAYNVNSSISKRIGIEKIRVYGSVTNLYTLTKYKGYDPEVSSFTTSDASIGIDYGNYPPAKTFTFGLDVTF